mmetsp:Transcript_24470/g.54386  ORF Transcript_24470/g.54386 Transcript_24470/m.54386 type:complete len:214 (+) Transcript_24470:69-710(+)
MEALGNIVREPHAGWLRRGSSGAHINISYRHNKDSHPIRKECFAEPFRDLAERDQDREERGISAPMEGRQCNVYWLHTSPRCVFRDLRGDEKNFGRGSERPPPHGSRCLRCGSLSIARSADHAVRRGEAANAAGPLPQPDALPPLSHPGRRPARPVHLSPHYCADEHPLWRYYGGSKRVRAQGAGPLWQRERGRLLASRLHRRSSGRRPHQPP